MKIIAENLAVAVMFLFLSGCSFESSRRQEMKHSGFSGTYAPGDADFLASAAGNYLRGISLGEIAMQNASEPEVRKLAVSIRSDKYESMSELKRIAASRLILIPTEVSFDDENIISKISQKKGREFDEAFCLQVESNHRQIITDVEQTMNNIKDEEIRAWAVNSLPHLRSQLLLATECRQEIMNKKIHN